MYFIDRNGNYYEGDKVSLSHLSVPQRPTQFHLWQSDEWRQDYAAIKRHICSVINHAAGEARARYMTSAVGQDIVYMMKELQARDFRDSGYAPAKVPAMVRAEMETTNNDAKAAADSIITAADQWAEVASKIEKQRRYALVLVDQEILNSGDYSIFETIMDDAVEVLSSI